MSRWDGEIEDTEIIMELTDAEILDALTANIVPPDAPPRHTKPPTQPPLQTGFATRPPPTAAISEASFALRAVEVVSAWFDVPAIQTIAPNNSSVNRNESDRKEVTPTTILLFLAYVQHRVNTQAHSDA